MDTVRFIMVGTGGMGRAHIRQILRIPEAQIVALVDPAEAAISSTREASPALKDVPSFSDLKDAMAQVEADAVVIVSRHCDHLEQGVAALEAGLNVLMEKPFVSGSANAAQLIELAAKKGKHIAVSYQRHLQGPYMYIRDLIQSGALGTINFISAYQAQHWLENTKGSWRQDPVQSCGGQLNDSGSHLLDVVLWSSGLEPEEVSAVIDNRGAQVDIDSAVTIRFKGGAIASFNIVGSASISWHEDVSVHGSTGSALFRNGQLLVATAGEQQLREVPESEFSDQSNPDQNFVDLILGRVSEAAAPAACGLAVARVTEAAWKSAEAGRPVRIDELEG